MPDRARELLLVPVWHDAVWGGGMKAPALGMHVRAFSLALDRYLGRGVAAGADAPPGYVFPPTAPNPDERQNVEVLVRRGLWVPTNTTIGRGCLIAGFDSAITAMGITKADGNG